MAHIKQTILVVDDTLGNIDILKAILEKHYSVKIATSGEIALKIIGQKIPDLLLLDVMMPGMDGHEVCRRLQANVNTASIPVIFVTAMSETHDEQIGFDLGAVDYITKPIKPAIVLSRVQTQLALANQRRDCEVIVELRTNELASSQRDAINMLARAGHYNDSDTGAHIWRMAEYSAALAKAAHWSVKQVNLLELAAPMHDTGKIGVPDSILKAPRPLADDEWVIMRSHTEIGHRILNVSDSPLFELAAEVALAHHEKWDGTGYPKGLEGEDIPESARIVAIADVFDALTMARPYKDAWPVESAFEMLKQGIGTHFEKRLVDLFISIEQEIIDIKNHWDKRG